MHLIWTGNILADDFEPLTAEEVNQARSDVLMDPLQFRAELWRHYEDH